MDCPFTVGQRVVCIDDRRRGYGAGDEIMPVEGNIYTIRELSMLDVGINGVWAKRPACRLAEIVNMSREYATGPDTSSTFEGSFGTYRFRPLVDTKTDISQFRRMLVDA